MGRGAAGERGQDGPDLRLAAAQGAGGQRRGAEIVTRGRGYELRIDATATSTRCASRRLVAERDLPREALALWRGEPLADVADEPFAAAEIRRLEELRLTAAELAIDADLAAGRHHEVVGELEALLAEHPLRERLHAQRMLALYRCGRQAEALRGLPRTRGGAGRGDRRRARARAARLHEAILRQDPSLDAGAGAAELPPELDARHAAGRPRGRARRLRERWRRAPPAPARSCSSGAYGMGKTRLAAELAGEVHREGGVVLYASGAGRARGGARGDRRARARAAADAARARRRRPRRRRGARRAARARDGARRAAGARARHGAGRRGARAARADATLVLEPLDADAVPRDRRALRARATAARCRSSRCSPDEPRRAAPRPRGRERVGAARGDAPRRRGAAGARRPAHRAARAEDELAGSVVELQSARERAGPPDGRPTRRWSARTRASRRSTSTTPSTSSGASGSSPSWSRAWSARRCSGIVGPSGSGKSSALRAGLLPALAGGVLPGSEQLDAAR